MVESSTPVEGVIVKRPGRGGAFTEMVNDAAATTARLVVHVNEKVYFKPPIKRYGAMTKKKLDSTALMPYCTGERAIAVRSRDLSSKDHFAEEFLKVVVDTEPLSLNESPELINPEKLLEDIDTIVASDGNTSRVTTAWADRVNEASVISTVIRMEVPAALERALILATAASYTAEIYSSQELLNVGAILTHDQEKDKPAATPVRP
jgi:hypothetical protein